MKKMFAIILCIVLAAAGSVVLASCGKQETNDNPTDVIDGGWAKAENPEITDEIKELFKKATEGMTGLSYTPVVYVASQIVAGTNHCILCKTAAVVPNPEPKYSLVYIYEDLNGGAEITNVVDTGVDANYPEGLSGGWSETQSIEMTDDATAALNKATQTLTGAEYSPIALLATQVVAGTNYRIFCEAKATVPNAEPYYVIITVYADLDGNAEITDTAEINA